MMRCTAPGPAAPWAETDADTWVRRVVALHCDPVAGSPYWIDKQARLGIDARAAVRTIDDLALLGPMEPAELRSRPVVDFVPRALRDAPSRLRVVESGGTTGAPTRTAFERDEFAHAFAGVFATAAHAAGWPRGVQWLACVPGPPHLISDAAKRMARWTGSAEPFTIDLDPRWVKSLPPGGPAFHAYVEHLVAQAIDVLRSQHVEALFITPKLVLPLAERMREAERLRIRAVHLGGMAIDADLVHALRASWFPNALFLAGYGNSLCGLMMEAEPTPAGAMDYFTPGPRYLVRLVEPGGAPAALRLGRQVAYGAVGQVVVHRLDSACMLVNCFERDHATRIPVSDAARALGWTADGVRDPHVPAALTAAVRTGVY